ncbi:hypothetical protein BDP27DRAFT_1427665 [Rhodocollybia butyracea]|uniref:NB-ARC domain-containing protein n=1 Tax=Rhodocollybia butyracea TaxID=206335 RepID=A0A9P5PFY6_9AGAR|nr:hypothetical protein BDP27DRAFT_1427665 [Rhodocollybia butyracea]
MSGARHLGELPLEPKPSLTITSPVSMFSCSRDFTITNSQFIQVIDSGSLNLKKKGVREAYEIIKLFTPSAPTVFTGRDHLVTEAVTKLTQESNVHLAILGAGGIGKTALALHIMKNLSVQGYFRDKIYFIPCEILSETSSLIQKHLSLEPLIKQWKQTKTAVLECGPHQTRLTSVAVSVDLSVQLLERQNMDFRDLLATISFLPSGIPFWQKNIQEFVPGQNIHSVVAMINSALVYQQNEALRMLSPIREHLLL